MKCAFKDYPPICPPVMAERHVNGRQGPCTQQTLTLK